MIVADADPFAAERSDRLSASASGALRGRIAVPGDKSISHRALILAALAEGESRIEGLLEGQDVLATEAAVQAFGASIERRDGARIVQGRRLAFARRSGRLRQFGHRRAPADGRRRRLPDPRDLHRRRLAARPADGAGARAARADGRPVRGRRSPAGHPPGRLAARPVLHQRQGLGAGQVGDPAGRAARQGRGRGDRAEAEPRPYRADAPGVRLRGRNGRGKWRAYDQAWPGTHAEGGRCRWCPATPRRPPSRSSRR